MRVSGPGLVKAGKAMKTLQPLISHSWDLEPADAVQLQRRLSAKVIRRDRLRQVKYVAGVDVAYAEDDNQHFAAVALFDARSLALLESSTARQRAAFPYISGLLAFRELPAVVKALESLHRIPDLTICDGQGLAHPRRFGLACHLGVLFDMPTIGCSKSRLWGRAQAVAPCRGSRAPLTDKGEIIGAVLRTRDNVKPVYVSIGHRVCLQTACDWILKLTPAFRLPETTRRADQIARRLKRKFINGRDMQ